MSDYEMKQLDRYYRNYAKIDLDAIYDNMKALKANVKATTDMVAVIKTDGYGHGAVPIAKTIDGLVNAYAVATIDEAVNLRNHNISKPIYLLGYTHPSQYERLINNEIRAAIFKMDMAKELSDKAVAMNKTAYVHIKVDTGMSRIGFKDDEESADIVKEISKLPNIYVEGIFTHFAASDETDKTSANKQLERFGKFLKLLEERDVDIKIKHCSNSAGIIDMHEANFNQVRAGIALYGLYPSDEVNKNNVKLTPALSLYSHIAYIKTVGPGVGISYGGTYVTTKDTRVATILIGYGDGYERNLSNKGYVLINGKKAPILGRVCMDQLMVDVTDIDAKEGDIVTLIGKDSNEEITVEEIAEMAGTFNYEFVCDLGKRIPRVYYRNGKIVCTKDYFDDEYDIKE